MDYGWQIDPALWASIPKELSSSRSWQSVGFSEVEAEGVPYGESGIYMFCTSPVGIKQAYRRKGSLFSLLLTPIYVGRTTNLRQRFIQHCRRPSETVGAARKCFGTSMHFWYHLRERGTITSDEAMLIACFGPPANRRREAVTGRPGARRRIGIPTKQN